MSKKTKNFNDEPEHNMGDMSMQEIFQRMDRRSRRSPSMGQKVWKVIKDILLFPPRILGAMIGVGKYSLEYTNRHRSGRSYHGSADYSRGPSPAQSFRDSYRSPTMNPYDYDMVNQMMYYQSVDGRGDPEPPCDCDHDHDDR